ncbi:MAG: diguanylate cyclase/phosphodiesterase (GGDEF & EAL domains) with PAS/PAC sensor(s) [uncultured Rubrobacteraceae bacterium]|uniref:Diguanylate cyclase/phosphodiesterase (GGDEF & EAL domains) with PAS/PAC sensor(S) n=1 Tax=uncultured Rubrobacteraceae bacterium TaxID=349277 RepID=A0A6J4QX46_9ACTN|nr:MAG: diguanylate cyclase/phosphodiesterase (GGDEF & EAL domains) with PAS/PAC sensor(s) [uncultured Rubrobacteraceae bacterium]
MNEALLKVLLVEDDEDDYVIIRDLLSEMERLELEWVTDYDDALKAIQREEHDVCLLDYRLGERSGLELLREASKRGYKAPIIFLTGQGDREVDLEAMQAGAADYLIKGQIDAPLLERSIRYAFTRTLRILGESEKRFRSLVQNASDITTVLDADGTIRYESPSIERLLGYRSEDLVGQNAFDYVHPDDLERVRSIFGEATKRSGASRPAEVRFRHADGSWRYMEWIGNNLLEDPTVKGIVANSRDVTERKEAEEKLRKVREAERSRLARDLHDEALQDLTYALAEIQLVQAISRESELDRRLERAAGALIRAGQGLHGAIHDLRLREDQEQTLTELLQWIVKLNRQSSPEREIELSIEGSPPPLPKETQVELLRIVREALVNTRRHSGAPHVWVAVGTSEDKLWAEVSDDGRGFDPSEAAGGIGIVGMRERARVLGGNLEIRSELGVGTTVRFELALRKDRQVLEEIRILLVEDHASLRQAVAALFDREPGFTVVGQAGSLAEARTMLDGVDVAIVDLNLPDGYGGEIIKEMRDASPHAMVLVLSAYFDRVEIARAVESGAAGVLHKSAGIDEVVEAVRRLRAGETLLPLEEVVELLRFASSRREQEQEASQAIAQLTPREKEVLKALAEGLDGKEIARQLNISLPTERNHMASILAKLGMHSRLQALVFALRHGVVDVR